MILKHATITQSVDAVAVGAKRRTASVCVVKRSCAKHGSLSKTKNKYQK